MKKTIKKTKLAKLGLTDHSRSEQSLTNSELRYRRLFETSQDGILILDAKTGAITDVNPYLIDLLGYSREEFIEKKLWQVGAFKDIEASKDAFEALQKNEYICYENLPLRTKDGRLIQVEFISNVYLVGDEKVIQCNIRDVTEHKRLVAAMQENEKKYRTLVTSSREGIFLIDLSGNFISVNQAMCDELGFSEDELRSMNIWDIVPDQYLDEYRTRLTKILNGESLIEPSEYAVRGKDGKIIYIEVLSVPYYSEKGVIGFQGIARAITARKRAEEALKESERKLKQAQQIAKVGYWESDLIADRITGSEEARRIFGLQSHDANLSRAQLQEMIHPDDRQLHRQALSEALQGSRFYDVEYRIVRPDGDIRFVHTRDEIVYDESGKPIAMFGAIQDITERKRAEEIIRHRLSELEAVHTVSTALRTAQTRDQALPILLNETLTALETDAGVIWVYHPNNDELCVAVARGWFRQFEETSIKPGEGITGTVFATGQAHITTEFKSDPIVHQPSVGQFPADWGGVCLPIRSGAIAVGTLTVALPPPRQITPEQMKLLESLTEMAGTTLHRMSLHEETVRQLDRLDALHSIDIAISASMDLQMTLNVLLEHVKTQLNADATCVMLLNPHSLMLEHAAGRGFRTRVAQTARIRLGEDFAGRAALERRTVRADDPAQLQSSPQFAALWAGEGFSAYFGVPLIARGQVKGVLEVYHRVPFHAESDWISFLETLGGQAAIAIESAQLFENLQRSNTDLALAYDATIEGWSHALDLRDKETEGHTQRVTEITLRLAKAMGIGDAELVHIGRGALLHDIGKMGVADSILLKPGPLTDDEWRVMHLHPQLAFDMLSPIAYLKPALDIPYCHHEKWDGTGYPRGLKGEQIPLAARIFAVVDVWDALRSDRPYGVAWSEEKVRAHILAGSGTHFDPKVVDAFLHLRREEDS